MVLSTRRRWGGSESWVFAVMGMDSFTKAGEAMPCRAWAQAYVFKQGRGNAAEGGEAGLDATSHLREVHGRKVQVCSRESGGAQRFGQQQVDGIIHALLQFWGDVCAAIGL